jgi:hypothetical protein
MTQIASRKGVQDAHGACRWPNQRLGLVHEIVGTGEVVKYVLIGRRRELAIPVARWEHDRARLEVVDDLSRGGVEYLVTLLFSGLIQTEGSGGGSSGSSAVIGI